MVRFVPISRLQPGTVLARTVGRLGGDVLFPAGVTLSEAEIRRLAAAGFPGAYIVDSDGLLPDGPQLFADATRIAAMNRVWHTFRELEQGSPVEYASLVDCLDAMLQDILSAPEVLVNLSDLRSHDGYTFGHSVNVAALSMLIGHDLGLTPEQLRTLGLGALLHDIGKIAIPAETLRKRGPLSDEEWRLIREHPHLGCEIVRHYYGFNLAISYIAHQHHERLDGSGYPQGLRGDAIHRYARIVAVVDVFDAMRSERVYRPGVPVHKVLEEIRRGRGTKFASEVVDSLLRRVAPYPVGTTVQLSTGEVGVVTQVPPDARDRPVVRVLMGPNGATAKGQVVRRLADHPDIAICRVLPALRKELDSGESA